MIWDTTKRKIDFLIIGTQKGGTKALDFYLRQHPEVGMAKKKEVHFFDDEKIFKKRIRSYSDYSNAFNCSTQKKMYGEATPIYLYWEPCCRRIWEYNNKIKLIAILRNPIDRAFSHWNMEYGRKADKNPFFDCLMNERERTRGALPGQHRVYSYIDRGYYSEQIRRYRRFFPDEQLLFIKYDDFKNKQEQKLNDVFEFLGVNSDKYIFKKEIVNKRIYHHEMTIEERNYLKGLFKNDIHEVERILNWDCQDWLK